MEAKAWEKTVNPRRSQGREEGELEHSWSSAGMQDWRRKMVMLIITTPVSST
jgi:hypothetical protein